MNFSELFSLEARALYIWGAFGAFALVLAFVVILLRARLKRVVGELRDEKLAGAMRAGKGMDK